MKKIMTEEKQEILKVLLDDYWCKTLLRKRTKASIRDLKRRIADCIGGLSGVLVTEGDLDIEVDATDDAKSTITNFIKSHKSADWDYLEKVLSKAQLRRASKVSRFAELRISSSLMKTILEDAEEEPET
jgi:hypothetical protein